MDGKKLFRRHHDDVSSLQFSFTNRTDQAVRGVQGNDHEYAGTMPIDGLRIEPGQTAYRPVADYGYKPEFSPNFHEYGERGSPICGVCETTCTLSAADILIDFQLTAIAYTDGSFERFD